MLIVKSHDKKVFLIDDAASAMGNQGGLGYLGTGGDIGIFSFNQAKMLTAAGGGGVLINHKELLELFTHEYELVGHHNQYQEFMKFLKFFWNFKHKKYSENINYLIGRCANFQRKPARIGMPNRLSNLDSYIALKLITEISETHKKRSKIIQFYAENLKNEKKFLIPQPNAAEHRVSRFYVSVRDESVKWAMDNPGVLLRMPLDQWLLAHGVKCQYGYFPYFIKYSHQQSFQSTLDYTATLLALPVDHRRSLNDYENVLRLIKKL